MNKINTIYATEVGEIEQPPLRQNFTRFRKKLDDHIRDTLLLRKTEQLKQSKQLSDQLARIKERSGKYKTKIYHQQTDFYNQVQSVIQKDIDKYQNHQQFFAQNFQALEAQIKNLMEKNQHYKREIQQKTQELKAFRRKKSPSLISSTRRPFTKQQLTTIESSLTITKNRKGQRIKTDQSLPTLRSDRYERLKTVQTQYQSPLSKARNRSGSYMQPIGSIRAKEVSCLPLLLQLLQWYAEREDINSSWFLKVVFTQRNYARLRAYLSAHSGSRTIFYKK